MSLPGSSIAIARASRPIGSSPLPTPASNYASSIRQSRADRPLVEILDWAGDTLNRVDRPAFFRTFQETDAVQYFYEPFLEAFDPDLRKQLGVWYTPREIVQ